jgi:hypothetical protein
LQIAGVGDTKQRFCYQELAANCYETSDEKSPDGISVIFARGLFPYPKQHIEDVSKKSKHGGAQERARTFNEQKDELREAIFANYEPDGVTLNWNLRVEASLLEPSRSNGSGAVLASNLPPNVILNPMPRTYGTDPT